MPLTVAEPIGKLEVIDPEALLWCSLEFTPTQPRLAEGVQAWVTANRTKINRQRLNKLARTATGDPRAQGWNELDASAPKSTEASEAKQSAQKKARPLGKRADSASTLPLRSRDVLGNDCRSFHNGSPRGVRLRDVAKITGSAYRSISETATGWEHAGIVRIQHGYCVLVNPKPWCELLGCSAASVVVIDWQTVYQAVIQLLHTRMKAQELRFALDHALVVSAVRTANATRQAAAVGVDVGRTAALKHLADAIRVG